MVLIHFDLGKDDRWCLYLCRYPLDLLQTTYTSSRPCWPELISVVEFHLLLLPLIYHVVVAGEIVVIVETVGLKKAFTHRGKLVLTLRLYLFLRLFVLRYSRLFFNSSFPKKEYLNILHIIYYFSHSYLVSFSSFSFCFYYCHLQYHPTSYLFLPALQELFSTSPHFLNIPSLRKKP